jgi:hypothetical protein
MMMRNFEFSLPSATIGLTQKSDKIGELFLISRNLTYFATHHQLSREFRDKRMTLECTERDRNNDTS